MCTQPFCPATFFHPHQEAAPAGESAGSILAIECGGNAPFPAPASPAVRSPLAAANPAASPAGWQTQQGLGLGGETGLAGQMSSLRLGEEDCKTAAPAAPAPVWQKGPLGGAGCSAAVPLAQENVAPSASRFAFAAPAAAAAPAAEGYTFFGAAAAAPAREDVAQGAPSFVFCATAQAPAAEAVPEHVPQGNALFGDGFLAGNWV